MIFLIISTIFFMVVLGFLISFIVHNKFKWNCKKYMKSLKGPKPNPVFGNMLDFNVPSHEFLNVIKKYVDEYGKTVKLYDGPQSLLIITADERFAEYILSSQKLIEKSAQYDYFKKWLGTGLLISGGSKWRKRRRLITPAFHFSILENFVKVFERTGDTLVYELRKHVGEKSYDIYPLISLYTLDVICEAAMGIPINALTNGSPKYVKSVKQMCKIIVERTFSPLDPRMFFLTPNYFKEQSAVKVLHAHTDLVIDERIKSKENKTEKSNESDFGVKKKMAFLDLLLESTIDGQPLSRLDIREEVDTFMFEGHDTTASAIAFGLYCLSQNPSAQKKVAAEQREIFGDLQNVECTLSDLQNMKYLVLVIKETLRLYPSVPFYARTVTEEFEFDGSLYPKGTQIAVLAYHIQKNPEYYPDPNEFKPERFLDIDGTHPFQYLPFSAGPRNCIGQKFAMLEMKSTISKVLRKYELLPANPDYDLLLASEAILISKSGIRMGIKKRQ